jgi:hypothetical protein
MAFVFAADQLAWAIGVGKPAVELVELADKTLAELRALHDELFKLAELAADDPGGHSAGSQAPGAP